MSDGPESMTHAERNSLREEFDDGDRLLDELQMRFRTLQDKLWLEMIGPDRLSAMFASQSAAEEYLADPDPTLRSVALNVLTSRWKRDARVVAISERIALLDPEPRVRCSAIHLLGKSFRNTSDYRIQVFLARIVHDDSAPVEVRIAAYKRLFIVQGYSELPPQLAVGQIPEKEFCFPEDVDWSFVDTFATS